MSLVGRIASTVPATCRTDSGGSVPTRATAKNSMHRGRWRVSADAVRMNHDLDVQLNVALRADGRYRIFRNQRISVDAKCWTAVRTAHGGYVGISIPSPATGEKVIVEMVVVDQCASWAGAYCFCWQGSRSHRARRRLVVHLRAVELVLKSHLLRSVTMDISTVTIGVIDGGVDANSADDVTIALSEVADHFDIDFSPVLPRPPR
jgi:hypothetical protein